MHNAIFSVGCFWRQPHRFKTLPLGEIARVVQQRRWETVTFGGTQPHSANSNRDF
jgi:hypothetical protein